MRTTQARNYKIAIPLSKIDPSGSGTRILAHHQEEAIPSFLRVGLTGSLAYHTSVVNY